MLETTSQFAASLLIRVPRGIPQISLGLQAADSLEGSDISVPQKKRSDNGAYC